MVLDVMLCLGSAKFMSRRIPPVTEGTSTPSHRVSHRVTIWRRDFEMCVVNWQFHISQGFYMPNPAVSGSANYSRSPPKRSVGFLYESMQQYLASIVIDLHTIHCVGDVINEVWIAPIVLFSTRSQVLIHVHVPHWSKHALTANGTISIWSFCRHLVEERTLKQFKVLGTCIQ
jgi:hypothetical protein